MIIAILIISAITCVLILSILVHLLTNEKEYDIFDVYQAASSAREKCIKDARKIFIKSTVFFLNTNLNKYVTRIGDGSLMFKETEFERDFTIWLEKGGNNGNN